eukprot:1185878-Ditylum_brightwellii.AAC.1
MPLSCRNNNIVNILHIKKRVQRGSGCHQNLWSHTDDTGSIPDWVTKTYVVQGSRQVQDAGFVWH